MEFFKPGSMKIDFVGRRRFFIILSMVMVVASMSVFLIKQMSGSINWGIDFAGGTVIDIKFSEEVGIGDVRKVVSDLGYSKNVIQRSSLPGKEGEVEYMIRVERIAILGAEDAAMLEKNLKEHFGEKLELLHFDEDSGDQFELRFKAKITEQEVKDAMGTQAGKLGIKDLKQVSIRMQSKDSSIRCIVLMTGVSAQIEEAMRKAFPKAMPKEEGGKLVRKVEFVGPQVGSKLRTDGILSILYAIVGILVYVALRFNFQFAPGAVLALAHDSIIVIGAFALFGLEFNLTFVAAIMTVIGYSVNDTIVVYDRIRENMNKIRNQPLPKVINSSLNEVLNRTVLTSLTTIMALAGLLVMGFGEIREFAIAMTMGVIVGTYSSIYVAGSATIWFDNLSKKYKKA
jgi:preprotein translocase subunit SecF